MKTVKRIVHNSLFRTASFLLRTAWRLSDKKEYLVIKVGNWKSIGD